jgi:hypothetical protein
MMDFARSGVDKARQLLPQQVRSHELPQRQFAPNTPWSPNFAQSNVTQAQNPNFGTLRMPDQFMQAPQYRPQFNMSNKSQPMPPFQGMGQGMPPQGMGPRPMPPQAQPMPQPAQPAQPQMSAVQAYRNRFR